MSLTPKNWSSFQHYKDRSPAWIKLHRGLLDNREYHLLTPAAAKALPLIWLVASECDGVIPDADELAFRLRISVDECAAVLSDLKARDFLVDFVGEEHAERVATTAQRLAKKNGFGTRHISDVVKREVWLRDDGKCCACGSTERIEYDHKRPVSKGGDSSTDNIQLLCRPCNRSKRTRDATQGLGSRSLEKEEETQDKTEKEKNDRSVDFEDFWKAYPRTPVMSKQQAKAEWRKLDETERIAARKAVEPYKSWLAGKPDHPVVHACRFLSQRRFEGFDAGEVVTKPTVFVVADTPQFAAWEKFQGRKIPRNKDNGWHFESEWPPGHTEAA